MSELIGFSKGLYSSWFYYSPTRTLFDCGEGCATHLGNKVFAIEEIMLSHGHIDHIGGLLNLINIRNKGMGDKKKNLFIHYNHLDSNINELKNFISKTQKLSYEIYWYPYSSTHSLVSARDEKTDIEYFKTNHTKHSVGFKVIEERRRLKPEYRERASEIGSMIRRKEVTSNEIHETYRMNILTYCLDSYDFDPIHVQDSDMMIADCTFLDKNDRDRPSHMTMEEVVRMAKQMNVKRVLFAHISPRYTINEVRKKLGEMRRLYNFSFEAILPRNNIKFNL